MKITLPFIFSLLLIQGIAQSKVLPYVRTQGYSTNVYFVDSVTMKPVNKKAYDYDGLSFTVQFYDGMLKVMAGGKYGFIDDKGVEVIPPQYSKVTDFHEGFAGVSLNGKWGFVDKKGMTLVTPQYEMVYPFREGMAAILQDGKWGFINTEGKLVVAPKYTDIGYGQFYGNKQYEKLPDLVCGFYDGRAVVGINNKYGYIDKSGREIIPLKYSMGYNFMNKKAQVEIADDKTGIIDVTGKYIVQPVYGAIFPERDLFFVSDGNNRWGCLDSAGKLIVPLKYDYLFPLNRRLLGFTKKDLSGLMDLTGKIKIPAIQYTELKEIGNGFIGVKKNEKWGITDINGKEILSPQYDDIKEFHEHLAAVMKNGQWGFMNETGKEVIRPQFDFVNDFSEGLAAVSTKGMWGYIDTTGKLMIPFRYQMVTDFYQGWALVNTKKNDYYNFFIDKQGREFRSF